MPPIDEKVIAGTADCIDAVRTYCIPKTVAFKEADGGPRIGLVYDLAYDTQISELDELLTWWNIQNAHKPTNIEIVAKFAQVAVQLFGWNIVSLDAITVVWMATEGVHRFKEKYRNEPDNKLEFYYRGLVDGHQNCCDWEEYA